VDGGRFAVGIDVCAIAGVEHVEYLVLGTADFLASPYAYGSLLVQPPVLTVVVAPPLPETAVVGNEYESIVDVPSTYAAASSMRSRQAWSWASVGGEVRLLN